MNRTNPQKESEWRQRFADWKRSGLSAINWCKANNIKFHNFKYWRGKLPDRHDTSAKQSFIELPAERGASSEVGLTVRMGDAEIKLERDFDEATLERLLAALRRST